MARKLNERRQRILKKIVERDGLQCFCCGTLTQFEARRLLLQRGHPKRMGHKDNHGLDKRRATTLDHVIPISNGGKDAIENGVVACYKCNSERGNTPLWLFIYLHERFAQPCGVAPAVVHK